MGGGKDQVTESKYSTLQSFTDAYGGWDRADRAPKSNGAHLQWLRFTNPLKSSEICGQVECDEMR